MALEKKHFFMKNKFERTSETRSPKNLQFSFPNPLENYERILNLKLKAFKY